MLRVKPAVSDAVSYQIEVLYYINAYKRDRLLVDTLH